MLKLTLDLTVWRMRSRIGIQKKNSNYTTDENYFIREVMGAEYTFLVIVPIFFQIRHRTYIFLKISATHSANSLLHSSRFRQSHDIANINFTLQFSLPVFFFQPFTYFYAYFSTHIFRFFYNS